MLQHEWPRRTKYKAAHHMLLTCFTGMKFQEEDGWGQSRFKATKCQDDGEWATNDTWGFFGLVWFFRGDNILGQWFTTFLM